MAEDDWFSVWCNYNKIEPAPNITPFEYQCGYAPGRAQHRKQVAPYILQKIGTPAASVASLDKATEYAGHLLKHQITKLHCAERTISSGPSEHGKGFALKRQTCSVISTKGIEALKTNTGKEKGSGKRAKPAIGTESRRP